MLTICRYIDRRQNYLWCYTTDNESQISMNMWGFYPEFIDLLLIGFLDFLEDMNKDDLKSEFLLPVYINELLNENKIEVDVLKSTDKWFGVTYKEDKNNVVENIKALIEMGQYQKLKC